MSSIITFPSGLGFESYTLKLSRKSILLRSPYTGKRQVVAYPFALWAFSGKFSLQDTIKAALLRSFFAQLLGQANKFRFALPEYAAPSTGYAGAAGLVNGANQTGTSLVTDGWTGSTAIFKEGDYFTVNDELKIVTAAMTSSSGTGTISFLPALRTSPADNAALIIVNPTVMLSASTDDAASWDLTPPILYQFQLDAVEAVE
jgi:hypothetical protein